jgi:pyruvate/2-oxoglutarate/acetoin dehydrogenase E1 component
MNTRRVVFAKFGLTHDVLRHTFISMFVAKFRSMGEAALQAGNSESIIRKHYLDLKSKEEAEQFFGIMPKHAVVPSTAANADATLIAATKSTDPVAA